MFDRVTITYCGASYEIGRGSGFYGVWTAGGARSQPLERWPETPEGWTAAWSRFVSIEAPGTIVPVGRNTPPVPSPAAREDEDTGPFGETTAPAGETAETTVTPAGSVPYTPYGQYTPRVAPVLGGKAARIAAAALLGAGVILGVAGLFPAYIGGASLAQQAEQVTAHAIYLAVWIISAVLILLGGTRLRLGALLGVRVDVLHATVRPGSAGRGLRSAA